MLLARFGMLNTC